MSSSTVTFRPAFGSHCAGIRKKADIMNNYLWILHNVGACFSIVCCIEPNPFHYVTVYQSRQPQLQTVKPPDWQARLFDSRTSAGESESSYTKISNTCMLRPNEKEDMIQGGI